MWGFKSVQLLHVMLMFTGMDTLFYAFLSLFKKVINAVTIGVEEVEPKYTLFKYHEQVHCIFTITPSI